MFIVWVVVAAIYFAPTIAAFVNKKTARDIVFIFAGNLLLGWSIIGWLLMAWKATRKENRI